MMNFLLPVLSAVLPVLSLSPAMIAGAISNTSTSISIPVNSSSIQYFSASWKVPSSDSSTEPHIWAGLQQNNNRSFVQKILMTDFAIPTSIDKTWDIAISNSTNSTENDGYPRETCMGDSIKAFFKVDAQSTWTANFSVYPGPNSIAPLNSLRSFSHNHTLESSHQMSPFDTALLVIEIPANGSWDFGTFEFSDFEVISAANNTLWCEPVTWESGAVGANFTAIVSTPNGTMTKMGSRCFFDSDKMNPPKLPALLHRRGLLANRRGRSVV